jgi:chromosome segregation ATPase
MMGNEELQRIQALEQRYEAMDGVVAALVRQMGRSEQRVNSNELLVQELNRAVKLLRSEQKALRDQLAVMQAGGSVL